MGEGRLTGKFPCEGKNFDLTNGKKGEKRREFRRKGLNAGGAEKKNSRQRSE